MPVTIEEVEHVAELARLSFSQDEKRVLTGQLNDILRYVEKLNELDTEGVEPTTHVLEMKNVLRQDVVEPSLPQEEVLANAPATSKGHFRVPKVIG